MPGFNVCLPQPEGYRHSLGLLELCELLTFSLQDLGYDTIFSINDIHPDRRNIIVGCHKLPPDLIPRIPESTILVNTEQISEEDRYGWNQNIFTWVRAFETWDYSSRNIAAFDRHGLHWVKLLRIGHQPQLTRIPKAANQDIDVLFYGSVTDRRKAVLDQIADKGLNLVKLFGVYGDERDEYIARAKVVLNMHNHASEIFEMVRVHYLLSNAVAVVSEVNASTSIPDAYRDSIAGVAYEGLADECERLVSNEKARTDLEQKGYAVISQYPQTTYIQELVSDPTDPAVLTRPPVLSICLPTFNRSRYLDCLLEDLTGCIGELGFSYELLIGDNASTDNTEAVVAKYQDQLSIRYFRRIENLGSDRNVMQLFRSALGRYVVYVADDDLLIPAVLGRYIAHLEANPDIGAVFAPWFLHDRIAGHDFGQFYYLDQETQIDAGDHRSLFYFLVQGHIFPEIYVARTALMREAAVDANPFAFIFFVQIAAMVDRTGVTFSPEPFYRQVIGYFPEESRAQAGHEETKIGWDRYRGGLEYILARFASQLSSEDLAWCHRSIDVFARERMRVGLRVRTHEGKDWVDNYYIANRLRCAGNDSLLSAPYWNYRINAALEYLLKLQPFYPERATVVYYEDDPPRFLVHAEGFASAPLTVLRDRSMPLPRNAILLTSMRPDHSTGAAFLISEAELMERFP